MSNQPTLIVIVGPTAVGKTKLSIQLAKHFNCEILSADSRQFYKEMAIGTAKPTLEEMDGVPHHFINNLSIHEEYTAGKFEQDALACLEELYKTTNKAILVGGSGLFVDAVCFGFDDVPPTNDKVRNELIRLFETEGIEPLQKQVKLIDPEYYSTMDTSNPHRLMRAIEVYKTTGKPYSTFRKKSSSTRPFKTIFIGLNLPREKVYERINLRVDLMIEQGLLNEVERLRKHKDLKVLKTVGYQEFYNIEDEQEAIEKVKQNTRRFAKRQITWFKKYNNLTWFEPTETEACIQHITTALNAK